MKRIEEYNFLKKAPLSKNFECEEEEKLCGNNYCVPSDEKCPITSIGVDSALPASLSSVYGVSVDLPVGDSGFGPLHDD